MHAFPECHLGTGGYPRRLPLCYEDCVATRQLFCSNEWALLESNKERGFYVGSRGHFRLPRCEELPRLGGAATGYRPRPHGTAPVCSQARLTQVVPAQVTSAFPPLFHVLHRFLHGIYSIHVIDYYYGLIVLIFGMILGYGCVAGSCVKGRGRFYQGNVSVTQEGLRCQRWDSQVPHPHNRPPLNIFPEMQDAENFCRNAGGEEPQPWCYTTDPLVRWQHCNIPQCGNEASSCHVMDDLIHVGID